MTSDKKEWLNVTAVIVFSVRVYMNLDKDPWDKITKETDRAVAMV